MNEAELDLHKTLQLLDEATAIIRGLESADRCRIDKALQLLGHARQRVAYDPFRVSSAGPTGEGGGS